MIGIHYKKTTSVLSVREREILKHLSVGLTSREIGLLLNLSHHTIDTHRRNMIHKVEVKNSMALINMAKDRGWI